MPRLLRRLREKREDFRPPLVSLGDFGFGFLPCFVRFLAGLLRFTHLAVALNLRGFLRGGFLCLGFLLCHLHGKIFSHRVAIVGVPITRASRDFDGHNDELVVALGINAGERELVCARDEDFFIVGAQEIGELFELGVAERLARCFGHRIPLSGDKYAY